MPKLYIILFFLILFSSCSEKKPLQVENQENDQQTDRKIILGILQKQQKAWNEGNLEMFMNGYWESDSLKFIGKNGVTYGWQNTLDRYKKGYPNQEAMGQLTFTIISTEMLDAEYFFIVGKWHLSKESLSDAEGHFTLLWKKINGSWKIIADHSS